MMIIFLKNEMLYFPLGFTLFMLIMTCAANEFEKIREYITLTAISNLIEMIP